MREKSLKLLFGFLLLAAFFGDTAAQGQVRYRKLTFKDEFNGPAGAPVDSSKWTAETGGGGWGNQELEYHTNSIDNAYQDGGGALVIKAIKLTPPLNLSCWYGPCQYTSARLITKGKFEQKYGRFEARLKIPRGQGMWPAFWMLGNNIDTVSWPACGEIDIMENIGREPSIVHGTVHGSGYSGGNGIGSSFSFPNNAVFADDYHIYATEWSASEIRFFVDGNLYKTITPADLPQGAAWAFDHPFFMILNVAVGGGWPGSPDGTTSFPQTMMVDYVRVYKR
ncbi:MAG: glycoside hydrolase family 16 protein [Acidobacteria bacterium]|nr:glycoside hydrolase family 16 protein [Acidobacteriota bacterium]